jgi:deoxyxylulose-5-phosphate synthase
MGVPDEILEHMSRKQVLDYCGLSTEHVVARFLSEQRAPVR